MKETLNPFEKLLVGLVKAQVKFITVGGLACAFNGHVRATEDVDILIKNSSDNIERLLGFLSKYGEGFGAELELKDFSEEEGAIRVIESFPIDIFVLMSGKKYQDFEDHIQHSEIQGVPIPYLSKMKLIELKKGSLREKDRLDVIHLKQIK